MKIKNILLGALLIMLPIVSNAANEAGAQITLKPGQWATFCSTINVDFMSWYNDTFKVKAYYMSGLYGLHAQFVRIHNSAKAGTGVLLHNEGTNTVTLTVKEYEGRADDYTRQNYLIGVNENTTIYQVVESGNTKLYNYYLSRPSEESTEYGLFKVPERGAVIPAGKAYCQLSAKEEQRVEDAAKTGAKMTITIIDNPETTGINEVKNVGGSVKNQNVYDLSGRLVGTSLNGLKPGLYIQGGKKIMR